MKIKIFADCADKDTILSLNSNPLIQGFTTNPSLMRKAGITDYEKFAKEILSKVKKPVSFEVFADDHGEMMRQAKKISSWGDNVYVKIPITNSKGVHSKNLIADLLKNNIKINITVVTNTKQIKAIKIPAQNKTPFICSVFAGRIADTGVDPSPFIKEIGSLLPKQGEVLWASSREIYNIRQAEEAGAGIITLPPDLIKKINDFGYNLDDLSLDGVKIFYNDSKKSKYKI